MSQPPVAAWGSPEPPRPPQEPEPKPIWRRTWFIVLGVLVLLFIVVASLGSDPPAETASEGTAARATAQPKPTQPPKPEADASSQAACRHFRNVAGDIGNGLLTDEEAREKLKEVNASASVSKVAGIRIMGVELVQAMTVGDSDDLLTAVKGMDAACESVGL